MWLLLSLNSHASFIWKKGLSNYIIKIQTIKATIKLGSNFWGKNGPLIQRGSKEPIKTVFRWCGFLSVLFLLAEIMLHTCMTVESSRNLSSKQINQSSEMKHIIYGF